MRAYVTLVGWSFAMLVVFASVVGIFTQVVDVNGPFVLVCLPVCAGAVAAAGGIRHVVDRPAAEFVLILVAASGIADAVFMPMGVLEASWSGALTSVLASLFVCGLCYAADRVHDQAQAWIINEKIRERRRT